MSKEAVKEFYQEYFKNSHLQEEVRAITTIEEIIKLGKKYGYSFTEKDIQAANAEDQGKPQTSSLNKVSDVIPRQIGTYHYEFQFSEIPRFEELAQQVEHLKIKPNTVDINLYESSFREDDFNFASVSPTSPEFQRQYDEIMKPYLSEDTPLPEHEYMMRQFHLINLDLHVEHPFYETYFMHKLRLIGLLSNFFGTEVKFSGSLWYPPKGYRLWHTNEEQPGWRMYIIDFDSPESELVGECFFRYMNPTTKELVTLKDKPKLVRFFKIEKERDDLFWHCIVNNTQANRWSFGFLVPDNWMNQIFGSEV